DPEPIGEGGFGKKQWKRGMDQQKLRQQIKKKKIVLEELINLIKEELKEKEVALKNLINLTKEKKGRNKLKLFDSKRKAKEEKLNSLFQKFPLTKEEFIKELENIEPGLSEKLTEKEINNLCQTKEELNQLQAELENLLTVVLKILNNSQNNTDFLDETAKHKIIDDWFNNIVPCYGLSQDPKTKNYLMVMQYIEGGDLRKYLKNKNLTFKDKLSPHDNDLVIQICQGLRPRFKVKIPQLLKDLIGRWEVNSQKNTEFFKQFKEREQFLNNLTSFDYKIHPSAFYTSRLLDFNNLPEPQNSKEINDIFYNAGQTGQFDLEIPDELDQLNLSENQSTEQTPEQQALQIQPAYGTP
ncbi:6972_t:CDS:2, partial [Scutellospora calospora]